MVEAPELTMPGELDGTGVRVQLTDEWLEDW
jgi:hypothetical protein